MMYASHFGLRRSPFRSAPDTDAYYPATSHEVALAEIRRALANEEGIVLLTGEPGLGKTILVHRLLETLETEHRTAFITNTLFATRADLLQAILFDLDLPYQERTEQELRLELTDACLTTFREGGQTLIVVDEAQHLRNDHLEELRLLSNLEGKDGKAVQVLLVATPAIATSFSQPELAIFRQRLSTQARLEPLTPEESVDYLLHQVRSAGGRPDRLFGQDVLDILCHASRGNPRILNQSAQLAFSLAAEADSTIVDAEAAVEAVTRLGLDTHQSDELDAPLPDFRNELVSEADESPSTLPMPPVTRPPLTLAPKTADGPPTYIYGDEALPETAGHAVEIANGSSSPWSIAPSKTG